MYFLGIDQSLTSAGFAVLEEGSSKPVYLTNVPTGKLRAAARLAHIRDEFDFILKKYSGFGIRQAAMEGYAYSKVNSGKVFELGEIGGVLKLALHDRSVPLIIATPNQLKKFVTGEQSADKEDVQKFIKTKWKEEIKQDDMSDAYGLAQVARVYTTNESTFRHELEVVKAIRDSKDAQPSLVARGKIKTSL
jgi:Holliday junction resolvasome RuvABC endonuclease subunit